MKMPEMPPQLQAIISKAISKDSSRLIEIVRLSQDEKYRDRYLHWDELRHRPAPEGFSIEELWLSLQMARGGVRHIPLHDPTGKPFKFCVPDLVFRELHEIDTRAGGPLGVPEPITNPHTKDRYLVRSLMEEAITSSQLEGAATTREVAKEMIRSGRAPRDISEQMILNNFITMQRVASLKEASMSPQTIFALHKLVTDKTLEDPTAAGRFRKPNEIRIVGDEYGEVFHTPPPSEQLPARMEAMCDFANGKTPNYFIHPVLRAIMLHFWLAYDHPFVDGNGRTSRAIFYWSMLHHGCWLFEFISISHILRKSPVKYARSFLYTETDDNDLTYFIVAQTEVIKKAIEALHNYIDLKTNEMRELESHVRAMNLFNHRQAALIKHALTHPGQSYTFSGHQRSEGITYQTARTDLLELQRRGLLTLSKRGRTMMFAANNLAERLRKLGKAA